MPLLTIIPVTQEHIDHATQGSIYDCALAQAITATTGQPALVGKEIIIDCPENQGTKAYKSYQADLSVSDWALRYDQDKAQVAPTELILCPGKDLANNAHAFMAGTQPVCREHTKDEIP